MRVLGIDPGLATMGYGIIDVEGNRLRAVEYGTIETARRIIRNACISFTWN